MIKRLLVMAVVVILATAIFLPVSLAQTHMWVYTENGKTLNARTEPVMADNVAFKIPYGQEVIVEYHLGNGWTKIWAAGEYDYVYVQTRFLVSTPPGIKPTPKPSGGGSGSSSASSRNELAEINQEFLAAKLVSPYEVETRNARATGFVNMRWAPSKNAQLIQSYSNGTPLLVIAELKEWRQVEDPETGAVGFIRQDFLVKK